MAGSTQTSTLDIRLIDDVSPAAQRIASELRKLAEQGKSLDGVLANSGATDKMQANLKKIGAGVTQVAAVGKAWKDFSKEQGIALGSGERLTAAQIKAVKNWENVTVAGVRS